MGRAFTRHPFIDGAVNVRHARFPGSLSLPIYLGKPGGASPNANHTIVHGMLIRQDPHVPSKRLS